MARADRVEHEHAKENDTAQDGEYLKAGEASQTRRVDIVVLMLIDVPNDAHDVEKTKPDACGKDAEAPVVEAANRTVRREGERRYKCETTGAEREKLLSRFNTVTAGIFEVRVGVPSGCRHVYSGLAEGPHLAELGCIGFAKIAFSDVRTFLRQCLPRRLLD